MCAYSSCTETANKDGTWLREISSCCCLTTAGKTRQLLLNKIYIPFLPSLYNVSISLGRNRLIGDMMTLSGAFLSGVSFVGLEHTVRYYDPYEFLGFVGVFGSIITVIQM